VEENLQYVVEALPLIKNALNGKTALIGFAGSPWTLANFMLEGGSAKEFTRAKILFYSEPKLFFRLMEKLTVAVTKYLQMQIDAGVDTLQIFDTSGGLLADSVFETASAQWIKKIISALDRHVPVTVFSKGAHNWDALVQTGAQVVGVDWTVSLSEIFGMFPKNVGVQGNLDPLLLNTTPRVVAAEATRILEQMRGNNGFIFNLGHGVPPDAKLENLEALVQTVRNFK
jgi:uroporphyrinogen decarboxylase